MGREHARRVHAAQDVEVSESAVERVGVDGHRPGQRPHQVARQPARLVVEAEARPTATAVARLRQRGERLARLDREGVRRRLGSGSVIASSDSAATVG